MKFSMHDMAYDIPNLFYFRSITVRKPISFKAMAFNTLIFLNILQEGGSGFSEGAHVRRVVTVVLQIHEKVLFRRGNQFYSCNRGQQQPKVFC